MSTDRRGFLKWLTAGAVVSPVIGGVALEEPHVKLIEIPEIEIVQPPQPVALNELFVSMNELDVTVYLREKKTNRYCRMDCSAFITEMRCSVVDVTTSFDSFDSYRHLIPVLSPEITLRLTGQMRMRGA